MTTPPPTNEQLERRIASLEVNLSAMTEATSSLITSVVTLGKTYGSEIDRLRESLGRAHSRISQLENRTIDTIPLG